jgi:hypothetical protein
MTSIAPTLGDRDGEIEGDRLGLALGLRLGDRLGLRLGDLLGLALGLAEGEAETPGRLKLSNQAAPSSKIAVAPNHTYSSVTSKGLASDPKLTQLAPFEETSQ